MTRVGVVGAGRVGAVLAAALRAAGHDVVAVTGRSPASTSRIRTLLPGVPVTDPVAAARRCDLLLLTVPDDALEDVVTTLSVAAAVRSGQYVVHTSGRHGLVPLRPAADAGAHVLAMHPAMTFTGTACDVERLRGCGFGVTATAATEGLAEELVGALGGRISWVTEDLRPLYHAGLAHGANHLVTLVAQAMELLDAAGVEDPGAMLRPLLTAALDNALTSGDGALTGPVVRGDLGTVRAHLDRIRRGSPSTLESYVALAGATAHRALADGRLEPGRGAELLDALAEASAPPRAACA